MGNLEEVHLLHHLFIGGRMFWKRLERTDPPKPGHNFSILGIVFTCRNKKRHPDKDEPVLGEIDAVRHSPVHRAIEVLTANGFMEGSEEEKEEVLSKYAPGLKTVAAQTEGVYV